MPNATMIEPSPEMVSHIGALPAEIEERGWIAAAFVGSVGLAGSYVFSRHFGYNEDLVTPIKQIWESVGGHIWPGISGGYAGYKTAERMFPGNPRMAMAGALTGGAAMDGLVELGQEITFGSEDKSVFNPDTIPENSKDGFVALITAWLTGRKLRKYKEAADREKTAFLKNGTYAL